MTGEPAVILDYYTDPFCSWCWATEPMIRRIKETYGDHVLIRYKMGGLVENMATFYDAWNDIGRPEQVAPHWAEVSERTGMPIDEKLWLEEAPPLSTWPANIAYKAAQLQGEEIAGRYLRRLREAALTERKHLDRREVLVGLAREVGLDEAQFTAALDNGEAEKAFLEELEEARSQGISGFPTIVARGPGGHQVTLRGHRRFGEYEGAIDLLAGKPLEKRVPEATPEELLDFVRRSGRVTHREVGEVFRLEADEALRQLDGLADQGKLVKEPAANGFFFRA